MADFVPQLVDFARLGSQALQFFVLRSALNAGFGDGLLGNCQFCAQALMIAEETGDSATFNDVNGKACEEQPC